MDSDDPFTGTWIFRPALSEMSTPGPRRWVQRIECEGDAISVREEIDFGVGHAMTVEIEAKFNGKSYTVSGSPAADAIAYTRLDNHTIAGTASRQGMVTIQESLAVTEDGERMSMKYKVFQGKKMVARGIAMFERKGICR